MNLRKKSKKTILSSLIALALSSSMAFAMPQGGTVMSGNVNDVTSGALPDLVSGGILNVNGSSLIDWNSFSIGQNETLNVIFKGLGNNILVNHVSGGDISQLMGILNARQGEGSFVLVNPNGIVVGPQAQLNVGSLILSTLDVDGTQWLNVLKNGGELEYKNTKNGVLDIQGGKINVEDALKLYGAKIRIADGVTISNGLQLVNAENPEIQVHPAAKNTVEEASIMAANHVVEKWEIEQKQNGENTYYSLDIAGDKFTATPANTIEMGKAEFKNDGEEFSLGMAAGSITLNGTKFGTAEKPLSEAHFMAISSEEGDYKNGDLMVSHAGMDNVITLNDVEVSVAPLAGVDSAGIKMDGGVVKLKDSVLFANGGNLDVRAFSGLTEQDKVEIGKKIISDTGNNVSIKGGLLLAHKANLNVVGDSIDTKYATLTADEGTLRILAGKKINLKNYNEKEHDDYGEIGSFEGGISNTINIGKDTKLSAQTHKNWERDQNHFDNGRMLIAGTNIKLDGAEVYSTDRTELLMRSEYAEPEAPNTDIFITKPGMDVVIKDTAISGGDLTIVGNKVSLLGNTKIELDKGRFAAIGAGNKVEFASGDGLTDKDTYTHVNKADGKIAISQTTYDNLLKSGVMSVIKNYVIVEDTVEDNSETALAEIKDIFGNDNITEEKKVEKIKDVIIADTATANLMTSVRGHVDSATNAAPQTSTAIPAATNNVESTNVAAGEGVMSSDESSVKGVEEEKEKK